MHSRHRMPPPPAGAAIRPPNSMPPVARISPEARNFTYIRSSSGRMPPPKHPPPRKPDLLMEAGRLATQYLISQGLLPPNVLSLQARLGRGRRPARDYDYDFDWGKDNKRNADSDLTDMDFTAAAAFKPIANHLSSKPQQTAPRNYEFPDNSASNATTSTTGKQLLLMDTDPGASTVSDEIKTSNMDTDEANNDDFDNQNVLEGSLDTISKNGNDLLRLCDFTKVPTKTRSSLTIKGSKVETDEETTLDISPHGTTKVLTEESSESLSRFLLTTQTQDSKCLTSDSRAPSSQSIEDVDLLGSDMAEEKCEFASSQSLMDGSVAYRQESEQSISEFGRMTSMVKERGEKRILQDDGMREESKKPREWTSTAATSTEEYFPLHNFGANTSHSQHSTPPTVDVIEVDEERLFNVSILPRNESDSGTEPKEEKQLFPNSFKICDLNLMESSDMTGTHDSGSVYGTHMSSEDKKGLQVDVDLSISNNCNRSDEYDTSSADAGTAVIVEVDDDSAKEDEDFNISEKRTETAHPSLENFSSQVDSTGDLADGQDGYGLMISELLGAEIPNCSSGPSDITNIHGEMDLPNGAELLDEDDPIYLSLGEIPISEIGFLGGWEQPPQGFEKPF